MRSTNSNLSARLILYSCTFPFLDHPSLNRTKTCRTVPKKVHNPLKQTPSIIKSAIFLPDVSLLSPMTDRAQTVSMIHNDSHCNQHDFIYLWTNKSQFHLQLQRIHIQKASPLKYWRGPLLISWHLY